jgi:hypothetical protein
MTEVILKTVRNSLKHGQFAKATAFEITGNPPHVFEIKKVKKNKTAKRLSK